MQEVSGRLSGVVTAQAKYAEMPLPSNKVYQEVSSGPGLPTRYNWNPDEMRTVFVRHIEWLELMRWAMSGIAQCEIDIEIAKLYKLVESYDTLLNHPQTR